MLVQGDDETCDVLFGVDGVSRVRFWKTQTIGNDFLLFHLSDIESAGYLFCLSDVARQVCERRFGIGSDGMLVCSTSGDVLQMRMFNPDGTEDFCGNGLRCVAAHAFGQGWVVGEFLIEHFGRLVHAFASPDGSARVAIGPAVTDPECVPLDFSIHPGPLIDEEVCGYVGTAVNAGTTHFVTFVDELPSDAEVFRVGPLIEHSPLFPERTSVIFAKRTGEQSLQIRIWERGVGETLGCGTGSSAAAAELMRKEDRAMTVEVQNPGGVLSVSTNELGGSLVTESVPTEPFAGSIAFSI